MNQIDKMAAQALINGTRFSMNNTRVTHGEDGVSRLYLHNNLIATNEGGIISISNAGWPTRTTMARLNALPGVSIRQKDHLWFLNDAPWSGSWKTI